MAMLNALGNEFKILMDAPLNEIRSAGPEAIDTAISKMRTGDINIIPGFDGEFGKIKIFS